MEKNTKQEVSLKETLEKLLLTIKEAIKEIKEVIEGEKNEKEEEEEEKEKKEEEMEDRVNRAKSLLENEKLIKTIFQSAASFRLTKESAEIKGKEIDIAFISELLIGTLVILEEHDIIKIIEED